MFSPAEVERILAALSRRYPRGERPWAEKSDPFRTLIGTILSAQTTDAQVDLVTPNLFSAYPTPAKLASAKKRSVEKIIKSVGLYQAKTKNIVAAAKTLVEKFGGKVPGTLEELTELAGVGRKTANVLLIKSFGVPAMPVDTHVFRVANRIGLARAATPEKTEKALTKIIPRRKLGAAHFWLINHGRTLCAARNPRCWECPISHLCLFAMHKKIR